MLGNGSKDLREIVRVYANEGCIQLMEAFEKSDKRMYNFYRLRSCGRDKYSVMTLEEMRQYIPRSVEKYAKSKLLLGSLECAYRWFLRGLSIEDAVKKAEVDAHIEISKFVKGTKESR